MHFDIASPDPAAEQQRGEMLGGRRLEQYAGGGFLVMADPEGNEFCIIPEGPSADGPVKAASSPSSPVQRAVTAIKCRRDRELGDCPGAVIPGQ